MKKKVFYLLFVCGLMLLFLAACTTRTVGILTVFDSQNQQIFETTNSETLDQFSVILDIISEDEEDEDTWIELPDDAEVNYSYDVEGRKGDPSIRFRTYKNYPYITILDIPAVPEITIEMSEDDADMLNHPENWIK